MQEKKFLLKGTSFKIFLIVLILVAGLVIRGKLEEKQQKQDEENTGVSGRNVIYAEPVADDNKILQVFKEEFPNAQVAIACEEDVTDDGCKDLVVIYKTENLTRTVVVIDSGDGMNYRFTEPIPGPIENQKIQFKNIDKEGEIEFIITGEKGGAVGYAVYRMIDGVPTDLFGEGMEDCC